MEQFNLAISDELVRFILDDKFLYIYIKGRQYKTLFKNVDFFNDNYLYCGKIGLSFRIKAMIVNTYTGEVHFKSEITEYVYKNEHCLSVNLTLSNFVKLALCVERWKQSLQN